MFKFKEEIKNIGINGKVPSQFLNEDEDYNCVKAIIDWTLDFEMREYGVKDTYINIIKVTLFFDEVDGTKSYIIDDGFEFDWEFYPREEFRWISIFPVELWVDFDDKKVGVVF